MSSRPIGSKTGGLGAIPKNRTVSDDVSHHKKTWHIKIPTDSDDLGLGHFGCLTVNLQPAAPAGLSSMTIAHKHLLFFVWNDRFSFSGVLYLGAMTASAGNVDIHTTYIDQDWS